MATAVFRDIRNSRCDRVFRVPHNNLRTLHANLTGVRRSDAEQGFRQLCAPGPHQPGNTENFSRTNLQIDTMHPGRHRGKALHGQNDIAERNRNLRQQSGQFPARHQRHQLLRGRLRSLAGRDRLPIAQHRNSVRDPREFFQTMGNVNDARTLAAEASHDSEEAFGFQLSERGSGFVEDQHTNIGTQSLGNLYQLLFRHAERAGFPFRVNIGPDSLQKFARRLHAGSPVDLPRQSPGFVHQSDVFSNRQVREDRRLLIDRRQTKGSRMMRGVVQNPLPAKEDGARIRFHRTGQDFDERALPRPVFAYKSVNFARTEIKRNAFQRPDAPVVFRDPLSFKQQCAIILLSVFL